MEKELEIPMLAGVAGNKTTFALTLSNRVLVTRGTHPKSTHVVDV
jgi:hypothetical protein